MKKGKFGIVLCFYPIAAFAAVILNSPIIAFILAAIAVFVEKDEWAGRQTLQAWMASLLVFFFDNVTRSLSSFVRIPVLSTLLNTITAILFVLVYLAAIIFSVLSIMRVSKDGEANFPLLSSLAYRIYGKVRPKPVQPDYYQPNYQAPPQANAYPYPNPNPNGEPNAPQQPYPPYPPQTPPQQPQQYAAPTNQAGPFVPPQEQNGQQ